MTHRPELHVTPGTGILDAPAGALFDGESWHIFHQFRPRDTEGARWAHQFAEDEPFVFEECDDVLAPDTGEIDLRAGSVVTIGDDVMLYFTAVTEAGRSIHAAKIGDIVATTETVSDIPWEVDPNVQRLGEVVGDQAGLTRFRSPCVVPDWQDSSDREYGHQDWLMLAVTGSADDPILVILRSSDGLTWQLQGPLSFVGETGIDSACIVSPRIIRLRDEVRDELYDVLIITIEQGGIDISGYLVGTLSGTTFTVSEPFRRIDHGHDFTRPRNTNQYCRTPDLMKSYNDAHIFGLMNGVGRLDDGHQHESYLKEDWANCLSLPRRVTLQDGVLYQTPAAGLIHAVEESDHAKVFTMVFEVPPGESLTVELIDSIGQVAATITHYGDHLELDRSMNPHHSGDAVAVAPLGEDDTDAVTIVTDGSTVEVFADGGQVALASRVYFTGTCEDFIIHHTKGVEVEHYDVITPTMSLMNDYLDAIDEGVIR
ncbi:beta-fructosidase, levanase/invertase [Corynebacterium mustelae]|uniref:beta-fructofuranosidase n=1 Tax=Corynebacterium mustelae TaxID=571915 RepID=A0A0G3GWJ6_9CORY|nr:GH32 C-terminal domain-containing protein [Corynebacterium mustelae]AKK05551.1 beta-fructosidase, levanase/invertase [Corynebacterium mustelae]